MPARPVSGGARSASAETGTTLMRVEAPARPLDELADVVAEPLLEQVHDAARALEGARVLQVNATAYGGGVAELLASEVALMSGLGVGAEWRVICPGERLFAVTKRIHNAMQGQHVELSPSDWDVYRRHNEHCAAMLADEWDVVVVHDPQPAALSRESRARRTLDPAHAGSGAATSTPRHPIQRCGPRSARMSFATMSSCSRSTPSGPLSWRPPART